MGNGVVVPEIERDSPELEPAAFWEKYVRARRPVVIRGGISDESFTAPAKWDPAYLVKRAGQVKVLVEERVAAAPAAPGCAAPPPLQTPFGRGVRVCRTFAEVIKAAAAGDDRHYLTAQRKAGTVVAPPLAGALERDLPRVPAAMGALEPESVSLWVGASKDGTSSGLHHDFHDNLYVLLRGRKRFRLFSPDAAPAMGTYGHVRSVAENGVVEYTPRDLARLPAGDDDESVPDDVSDDDDDGGFVFGDDEASDLEFSDGHDDFDELFGEGLLDDGEGGGREIGGEEVDRSDMEAKDCAIGQRVTDVSLPDHFSSASLAGVDGADAGAWERATKGCAGFPGPERSTRVEVCAGDALYLPAGWFHEVESYGAARGDGAGMHLAVNWWFFPPTNLGGGWRKPYKGKRPKVE